LTRSRGDRLTGYWVATSATPFKGVPDSTLNPGDPMVLHGGKMHPFPCLS